MYAADRNNLDYGTGAEKRNIHLGWDFKCYHGIKPAICNFNVCFMGNYSGIFNAFKKKISDTSVVGVSNIFLYGIGLTACFSGVCDHCFVKSEYK